MPRVEDIAWTEESQKRVRNLLNVLLDYKKYPEQIKAEWTNGNPEPHHLIVHYTTKKDLADLIACKNLYAKELEQYKRYIQQSMRQLEQLKILVDKRKVKVGAEAKKLKFYLKFISENKEENMKYILETKWKEKIQESAIYPELETERADGILQDRPDVEYRITPVGFEERDGQTVPKLQIKFVGKLRDLTTEILGGILEFVRQLAQDPNVIIVNTSEGCVVIEFATTPEGIKRIEDVYKAGKLTNIAGFSILEVNKVPAKNEPSVSNESFWVDLSQWLQHNVVEPFRNIVKSGWEYEPALLGTYFALQELNPVVGDRSAFDAALSKSVGDSQAQDSQPNRLNQLIESLKKENQDLGFQFKAALELGESDATPEIIAALANRLADVDVEETEENKEQIALNWQIALSLGKLDPDHPKAAVAQRKEIQITDELSIELLVAIRTREDGDIDIFLQVYSTEEPHLPADLKLIVLDEFGQKMALDESGVTFLETQSREKDCEIHLSFFADPGEPFSVLISFADVSITENFII
jgi:hypothetical protein